MMNEKIIEEAAKTIQALIDSVIDRITVLHEMESTVNELTPAPEPQSELSDAQIEAAARSWVVNGGVAMWDNAAPHVRDSVIRRMREALRAAGVVAQEGGSR